MWFKKSAEAKVEASVGVEVEVKTYECDHKWKDFGISTWGYNIKVVCGSDTAIILVRF